MRKVWIVYDTGSGLVRSAWRIDPGAAVPAGESVAIVSVSEATLSHVVGMRLVGGRLVDPRLVGA